MYSESYLKNNVWPLNFRIECSVNPTFALERKDIQEGTLPDIFARRGPIMVHVSLPHRCQGVVAYPVPATVQDGATTARYVQAASSPERLLLAARSTGSNLLHSAALC